MNIIKYVGKQFAEPTGFGGKLSTLLMNRMNQIQYRSVIDQIAGITQGNILDIGFGNGYLLHRLAGKTNALFYGIEISKDMIEAAGKRNGKNIDAGKVYLEQGSVASMSFKEDFFDAAYTVNTIYFWEDAGQGFSEIYRVLKPGGIFVNVYYSNEFLNHFSYTRYDFKKYEPSELQKAAKESGFASVDIMEVKKQTSYCMVMRKERQNNRSDLSQIGRQQRR